MGEILREIQNLAARGDIRISIHGYDELRQDAILVREVVEGLITAVAVEEYPDFPKGRCVLALEWDSNGSPIHVVWGIPAGHDSPAVLVTAYRPDPGRWDEDWKRRLS
jgi:hypothetical protein